MLQLLPTRLARARRAEEPSHVARPDGPAALRTVATIGSVRPQPLVRWLARLVAVAGVLDVVAVLIPLSRQRLRLVTGAVPLVGIQTAGAATVAVGLVLIYLSVGLRRRTREAWALAVALTGAAAALNLLRGLDIEAALMSAVVCGVLVATRSSFVAVRGWSSRLRAGGVFVGFIAAGFAVGLALRSVFERGDRLGAGPVLRGWRQILLVLSRFWQIESLYRANAKYRATWEPRFLCYASMADLPRVGLAAQRAEAFVTMPPSPRQLLETWRQRSTMDSPLATEGLPWD
jgi:lysylphosphatidylglycerol synthetase-like protein (DUF2156 family)